MNISTTLLAETIPDLLFRLAEASQAGPAEEVFHSGRIESINSTRAVRESVTGDHNGGPHLARDSGRWTRGAGYFNGCELDIGKK